MARLAGLLLAAGASTRLGQSKQLLDKGGRALVRRQAELLLGVCDSLVVVTGADAPQVELQLQGLDLQLVRNPAWQTGMGGSLACGARALAGVDAVLLVLVDQWRVDAVDLHQLIAAWRAQPEQAVAACWPGCPAGPPVIFPASALPQLANLAGDTGARSLLASGRLPVQVIELSDAAHELDTVADLKAFLAYGEGNRNC
jgi:CTP:molybdopterin cytidylyltransferase MocA